MKNPSPAAHWLSQIESARTATDLVKVLREYLASLAPHDREQLAITGGEAAIAGGADIQEWAVTLAHQDLKTGGATEKHSLHEAAVVFAAAGARLAKVAG